MSFGSDIEDKAKALLMKLGMWWPDANSGTLRHAADAWRTFADSVDDVRVATDKAATTLIHHNKGEAIDAFEIFWGRYAKGKDEGWLSNLAKSARNMAKALDKFADTVDDAIEKLWTQISIDAVALVGGGLLTIVTGGASDGVAAEIIAMAAGLGVAVEEAVAVIAAEMLTGAVFTSVLSVTIDAAVAQPVKIALGQQKGFSLDEVNQAARDGMIDGGIFGAGLGVLKPGVMPKLTGVPDLLKPPKVPSLRPNLVEEGPAARPAKKCPCTGEPIDIATGAMLMEHTDLTLPGSLSLVFERTHVSSYRGGVWFGPTWSSLLDERIQLDAEGVVFAAADGMRLVYPVPEPGVPTLPAKGARWPLEWDGKPDGVMTVTDPETGVVRTFVRPAATEEPGAVYLALESLQDRNGARIDIERALSGAPLAVRHSGGYYLAADTEGQRVTALRLLDEPPSIYTPERNREDGTVVMRYGYDEAGNLTEVINSSGEPLRFTYDGEGRVTSWTDRNGTSFRYVYGPDGKVVRTEGSDGVFNGGLEYDDEARTTVYTDSLGHATRYRYSADGQLIEETDPLSHTTLTEWDARGDRKVAVTDPLGRTTRYGYDEDGNLTGVTLPDGARAEATYNDLCLPVEVTEPGGGTWRHTYDDTGNLLTTTDPVGATTAYGYTERGHLAEVTDALGNTTRLTPDGAGLPIAVTDPLGHTTSVRRDPFGRVVEATDPLGHTTRVGWTTEGKPAWREEPDGARESWTWDGEGNLLTHTDPAGHTTHQTSTHFDVPATRTEPDGATYAFAYDTELRLTEVTNPQGLTWTYSYDPAGRLTSETDFNGRTVAYTHDPAGDLLTRTAGETLHFTRDALGRTTEQRDEAGAGTTYAYDARGALTRAANPDVELTLERDALGRVLSETANGRTTTYAYDAVGHRTERTMPSGLRSVWTYDEAGRPAALRTGTAGTLTLTYDEAGRETERRIGEAVRLTQTWDRSDRLTTQTIAEGRGNEANRILQHRSYAYRPDGYLTEIRELTSGTRRFDLDPSGRVTAVHAHGWTETYAYDTAGNLTQATAPDHASPGDREFTGTVIHRAGRTTYEHDAQGRLTRRTRKLLNGRTRTWTYTWNAEDRLTDATTPDGDHWHYTYDPLGRRISKQRLAEDGTVAESVTFAWEDTRLAEQSTPEGKHTTWDYTPDTHRPLTQTDHTSLVREPGESLIEKFTGADDDTTPRFHAIITDLVGTPTELVTAAGDLAWQHRTTLWGTDFPTGASPSTVDCPLRFPGQYADPETGLYYNYFRHYDPETARYVTPDPLGLDPAPNHHGYVVNPMAWFDPQGLSCTKRPDLSVNEKQFGKKWGKHAQDYSLDPADGSSRTWFRDRMSAIHNDPDEVRQGSWNPQSGGGEDYLFYRKGKDLLVTKADGEFVTMFPQDRPNGWFANADVVHGEGG
ncbi:RHS repeat-associated core domain-containing protein [Streptomyces sp. 6N106]|uniref:RHS repeat-associated core domain-containing protein n=1 Tax=Streptomyces sp. 6N106 TaxID=3457418 RepID=UPI003FD59B5B